MGPVALDGTVEVEVDRDPLSLPSRLAALSWVRLLQRRGGMLSTGSLVCSRGAFENRRGESYREFESLLLR